MITLSPVSWTACFFVLAIAAEPKFTIEALVKLSYAIQIHWLNGKLFLMTWWHYRKLVQLSKLLGLPVPPFVFINVWERV